VFKTPVAKHRQPGPALDPLADQQTLKIVHTRYRVMVEPDEQISGSHPSLLRRRTLYNFVNAHTGSLRQLVPASERLVDRGILPGDAKVTAP
jgi:hypothetical protein